jgi:hypothetical protein
LNRLRPHSHSSWEAADARPTSLTTLLEQGSVVFLPDLPFAVESAERDIFSPAILSSSKNTSYDPATGDVGGTSLTGASRDRLRGVLQRFSDSAKSLVGQLLPEYIGALKRRRASFRPAEIAGRATSWRKDDTRLHLDAFPASPTHGDRILRVFSNVNPDGRARTWRVGEDVAAVAERFARSLSLPFPGVDVLMAALRITKTRRTAYDALMLQLHDLMKADATYQESCPQEWIDLPAGSTWLTFTDQVSHAAMAGQYQFEQTFLVPVSAMLNQANSPLRILERIKGRPLT